MNHLAVLHLPQSQSFTETKHVGRRVYVHAIRLHRAASPNPVHEAQRQRRHKHVLQLFSYYDTPKASTIRHLGDRRSCPSCCCRCLAGSGWRRCIQREDSAHHLFESCGATLMCNCASCTWFFFLYTYCNYHHARMHAPAAAAIQGGRSRASCAEPMPINLMTPVCGTAGHRL